MIFFLSNCQETAKFGHILAQISSCGDVITLDGDLGAGKTTLTQSIAQGLGVADTCYVTSPSFAILHEYNGRIPLYHFDFYRISDAEEIEAHGFSEYFYKSGLCVIEWAKIAEDFLPKKRLAVQISIQKNNTRHISIEGHLRKDSSSSILLKKLYDSGIILL